MKKRLISILFTILCIVLAFSIVSCGGKTPEDTNADIKPMTSVSGIKFDNDTHQITWNPVEGAIGYKISINGREAKDVNAPPFTYDPGNDNFNVSIIALPSDTATQTSSNPTIKEFSFLSQVHNIKMRNGQIEWDPIDGVDAYEVYLNENLVDTVKGTIYSNIAPNTTYMIRIRPVKSGNDSRDYIGVKSNEFTGAVAAAPTLRFENARTLVYWNAVDGAQGYSIQLLLNGTVIDAQTLGSSTTSYLHTFEQAGTYTVKIQTVSDKARTDFYDSVFTSLEIVRLPVVENITLSYPRTEANNTVCVSYDDIALATRFEIKDGDKTVAETTRTSFEYTFNRSTNEVMKSFVIYSKGDGDRILDSFTGKTVTLTKLATPTNIRVSDNLIVWDAVNKHNGYRVLIDGQEFFADVNQMEIAALSAGTHTVKIAARGNESNIVHSDFSNEFQITKLYQPQNLRIENNVLLWETVQNCESYMVVIDDLVQKVMTNSFVIDNSYIGENTTIKVCAIGNGESVISSNYSETLPLFRLSAPIDFKTNNDYVSWAKVPNAQYYLLYFNYTVKTVTGESFAWSEMPAGNYLVKVVAVGDGERYFTSIDSASISVKKLESPILNVSTTEGFYWSKVSMSAGYEALLNGEAYAIDKLSTVFKPTFTTIGTKTVQVRALGDGETTVSSSWASVTHIVTQESPITSFSLTTSGTTVTATVNDATEGKIYLFNFSGVIKEGAETQSTIIANAGICTVSVAVKGDGFNTIDSVFSASKNVTILNKVSETEIVFSYEGDDYYTVSWKSVPNAVGYTIKIVKTRTDGTVENEIVREKTAAETHHGIDMAGYSSVKITIIVKGDNEQYFNSAETTKVFYKM